MCASCLPLLGLDERQLARGRKLHHFFTVFLARVLALFVVLASCEISSEKVTLIRNILVVHKSLFHSPLAMKMKNKWELLSLRHHNYWQTFDIFSFVTIMPFDCCSDVISELFRLLATHNALKQVLSHLRNNLLRKLSDLGCSEGRQQR